MLRKLLITTALAASFVVIGETISSAVVTRIDNGNTWTVGKGDVQSLFGWNAKTTDAQFQNVSFTYEKKRHSDVVCEYTITYDESYVVVEEVGGERNSKTVTHTKSKKHTVSGSYNDESVSLMSRTLQYEMKKNSQGNVVGATIWPGGSSTTVDLEEACDAPVDMTAMVFETDFDGTVDNVRLKLGQATEVSRTVSETIFATGPVMTSTKSGTQVASSAVMTGTLWTTSSVWPEPTTTTVAAVDPVVIAG